MCSCWNESDDLYATESGDLECCSTWSVPHARMICSTGVVPYTVMSVLLVMLYTVYGLSLVSSLATPRSIQDYSFGAFSKVHFLLKYLHFGGER